MNKRLWHVLCLFASLLVPLGANTAKALELTVMTRNLYVGADLEQPLSLSRSELPIAVDNAWVTFQQTNYVVRMAAIAEEICSVRPHLVGLQEVMLLRASTPAGVVFFTADFLETLLAGLDAITADGRCGPGYNKAAEVQTVDVEMPMATISGLVDLRLTDHEVILARDDVFTDNVDSGTYAAALHYKTATILRGWVAVDAEINGATVRFASTHLESVSTVRHAQGVELIRILARENGPLILLGDFNTPAPGDLTYQFFLGAGYTDWPTPGSDNTCCRSEKLDDLVSPLNERIDIVFTRNIAPTVGVSFLIGVTPVAQPPAPPPYWPSDHAGVVTEFAP